MRPEFNQSLAWIFFIALWILTALPLYTIAQKTGEGNAWLAFIPILQLVLLFLVADMSPWWILTLCIPCINIVVMAYAWSKAGEAMEKPAWVGWLTIVPGIGWIVPFYIAYA